MTLVEVLITLAVLVASAFIVWPVIQGAFNIHRLKDAGKILRDACAEGRLKAVGLGQIHAFRFQPEGRSFIVEPLPRTTLNDQLDALAFDDDAPQLGPASEVNWSLGQELPEGIFFVTVENRNDNRDQSLGPLFSVDNAPEARPLMFYPDGTTSTATIILRDDRGRFIEVRLDGVSGGVIIGEPVTAESRTPPPLK